MDVNQSPRGRDVGERKKGRNLVRLPEGNLFVRRTDCDTRFALLDWAETDR